MPQRNSLFPRKQASGRFSSRIVAAVCFLTVVYVTGINYRSKELPR